jgi:hypothetical protein
MSKVRVIATHRGYDNVAVREVGEEFTVPREWLAAKPKPSWFSLAVEAKPAAKFVPQSQGDLGDTEDPRIDARSLV